MWGRTSIPADGIYSSRHYIPDRQGARIHIHQRQCILAFYSQYSLEALKQIFKWHKSFALTRPFIPPIMQNWPAHIYITVFAQCLHVCECVSACINVFDPDINSEGTKLSSLPLADVKTGLMTTRTCCEIICRLLWCLRARPCSLPF